MTTFVQKRRFPLIPQHLGLYLTSMYDGKIIVIGSEEISQIKQDTTVAYFTFRALVVAHDRGGQDGRHLDLAGQRGALKHRPQDETGEGGK